MSSMARSSTEMRLVNVREREAHADARASLREASFRLAQTVLPDLLSRVAASLSRKRDTVTLTGDIYLLRTTTPEGTCAK